MHSTPEMTRADVAQHFPNDAEAAAAAFVTLARLVEEGLIDIYLPAGWSITGRRDFNVWLGHTMAPPHGERVTLEAWCARWYATWQKQGGVQ